MELGAQLDRTNAEFFAGQDIRRTQAAGSEERLRLGTAGEQERATRLTAGEQERLGTVTTGEQYRKGLETAGEQTRMTDLQQEMFRRYKENRDYEQAQSQYRT
jgi:hypothetical protein